MSANIAPQSPATGIAPDRLVTYAELKPVWGIKFSRPHLARLEQEDKFPKRVRLGACSIGWLTSELTDYLGKRAAARSEVAA